MPPALTLPLDDEVVQDSGRVEFEVPPSANAPNFQPYSANAKKHFSIDFSLELERQLELESLPNTPAKSGFLPVTPAQPSTARPSSVLSPNPNPRESMDAAVLAHIVTQLRESLAEMTKERDDLLNLVSTAHSKEAELKDALQLMTDKATDAEEELAEARRKAKDDEEAISMLRSKVEESRRGLMRLQNEKSSRRQSVQGMALDLSRAGIPNFGGPTSSKRASFTPLTGSLSADGGPPLSTSPSSFPPSLGDHPQTANVSRRLSGIFGSRGSPPQVETSLQDVEIVSLKKEVKVLKDEMEDLRHELTEVNEAREASDICAQALRTYIEENSIGKSTDSETIKLPPLPASSTPDAGDNGDKKGGWGFNLWKVDTTVKPVTGPRSASSGSSVAATVSSPSGAVPPGGGQLAKKFGGFFSGRASISSTSSPVIPTTTTPQLQSNAASARDPHRESVYSVSDTSSLVEPVSPTGDYNGNVRIHDANSVSSVGSSPREGIQNQAKPLAV